VDSGQSPGKTRLTKEALKTNQKKPPDDAGGFLFDPFFRPPRR